MVFVCISVRFKDELPYVNFNEEPTYHTIDPKVIAPRRALKPGDLVLIRTIGMPLIKMVVDRIKDVPAQHIGNPICGKASFFDPQECAIPFADLGGAAPA